MLEDIVCRLDKHLPIWLSSRPERRFVLSVASLFTSRAGQHPGYPPRRIRRRGHRRRRCRSASPRRGARRRAGALRGQLPALLRPRPGGNHHRRASGADRLTGRVRRRSRAPGALLSAAWSEVVAGCGASDWSPNQPAPAQRERGKHVFATGAPHLGRGSGSVVRLSLGQAPDPHVIRPPWKLRPKSWHELACLAATRRWQSTLVRRRPTPTSYRY
jgi:hypothetical protein